MHVTGIVAEYNPFHNGHLYQLTYCKKQIGSDFVIAVMSGHFTQRGLPSIADKFTRTQMALHSGIDLVLELPVPFATASAERFSEAAVSLLHKTGCTHTLSFGSEVGNLELLQTIASTLSKETPLFSQTLKHALQQGESFPRARQKALIHSLTALGFSPCTLEKILESPNNILGIEYLRALTKWESSIIPTTLKREIADYHQTVITAPIASATAIRQALLASDHTSISSCMPPSSFFFLPKEPTALPQWDDLGSLLQYKLMLSQKEDLYSIWDVPKDLMHSIYNTFSQTIDLETILTAVTSKTYTRATVQRAFLRLLLDIKKIDMLSLETHDWIPYIRVLGCRKTAFPLLKKLTQKASVPIITNLSKVKHTLSPEAQKLLTYEIRATQLYYYLCKKPSFYFQDYTQPFIKV
ncbi:hypothetical protein CS063_07175 [Sporanaerobium hydrogeniformans]|uniref:Uncharacterized protein n=1 Tax=Sporanaerobium hydrogeniformans TaxID=3072179 RepID=A0AC61DDY0_9FIRM|nr:nucleotidyltransferase [Sporanaerobium hydrogeniformans]PHV71105.1 hypothetical protein CS063_07175 [Sporanaerobium hydrogeniformans]